MAPAAIEHSPEQQVDAWTQVSPDWMHQAAPSWQAPSLQKWEQQSPPTAQGLPAVRQLLLSGSHTPPAQLPLQQADDVLHA